MQFTRKIDALIYSGHALDQMFARDISVDDIKAILDICEVVASYPDDRPYPTELLLGWAGDRPIHVVLAYNETTRTAYIVTTYVPDAELWSKDYKTRRTP